RVVPASESGHSADSRTAQRATDIVRPAIHSDRSSPASGRDERELSASAVVAGAVIAMSALSSTAAIFTVACGAMCACAFTSESALLSACHDAELATASSNEMTLPPAFAAHSSASPLRREVAVALVDKERRLAEELEPRCLVVDIGRVELGAGRAEFRDRLEELLQRRIRENAVARMPDFVRPAGIRHERVDDLGLCGFVIYSHLGVGALEIVLLDPGVEVQGGGEVVVYKDLMIDLERIDPLLLERRILREMAPLGEIEVEHLFLDTGPLFHQIGRPHGILIDPFAGVVDRLDEGDDHLRIFLGEVLSHDDAVQI